MPQEPLQIPDRVRRQAEVLGADAWLRDLPHAVAAIERDWRISIGTPFPTGTEAFTANARTVAGEDVVVKFAINGVDPTRQEMRALSAAAGRGYARLLRADETNNILLLEKLGPQLHARGFGEDRMMETICTALRAAWMPHPAGAPFVTGAEKAAELAAIIEGHWLKLGKPCPAHTIEIALECAARRARAFDPAHAVIVHGDAHEWNTLSAGGESYKFIDPDGCFAERAFDLAVPMREWGPVLPEGDLYQRGRHRCHLLAALTGVETAPIWDWSIVQCVWNGLLLKEVGMEAAAAVEFSMAGAWAAADRD